MDKVKAWLEDKKNLPFVIAGGAVIIIGIVLFFVMRGRANAPKVPATGASGYGAQGYGAPGGMPGMPGGAGMKGVTGMGGPGMAAPGFGAGMGAGVQAQTQVASAGGAVAAGPSGNQPMLPYRKDPFLPLGGAPTRSKVIESLLPQVSHYQFPLPVKPVTIPGISKTVAVAEVLPPQPFRRMAGVMINGRVSAILETNGEADIVVPGMEVTRGNSRVRVESITSDEIILKTLDTKRPFTIKVNLTGAVAIPSASPQNVNVGGQRPNFGAGSIYPVE